MPLHRRYKKRKFARRRTRPTQKKRKMIKKVVKQVLAKREEVMKLDHKYAGSQGATYSILPWGVDSDLARGTVCGDLLPINQLDNIHLQTGALPPTDSVRLGNEIFLKSIRVQLRVNAPTFFPTTTPSDTAINKQGADMHAKIRILVILDTQGEQSLPLATSTTGILAEIYDDLQDVTSSRRSLPTFKGYVTNKRWRVLSSKVLNLDGSKYPYRDHNFSIKMNRKITFIPGTDTCKQGVYVLALSDYPASTGSHTVNPPQVESFWVRYYYTDC